MSAVPDDLLPTARNLIKKNAGASMKNGNYSPLRIRPGLTSTKTWFQLA